MASIKTNLNELSVIIGIGSRLNNNLVQSIDCIFDFNRYTNLYCNNITCYSTQISRITNQDIYEYQNSITNGLILGRYIVDKLNQKQQILQTSDPILWLGPQTQSQCPFDIKVGQIGFSIKEDSFILKNPGFNNYINDLTQIQPRFKKGLHIFRYFSHKELEEWFRYCYVKLKLDIRRSQKIQFIRSNGQIYNVEKNGFSLEFKNQQRSASISFVEKVREQSFNNRLGGDIVEHTFSKWISNNLEGTDNRYEYLKRSCAIESGNAVVEFINKNLNPDVDKILEWFQIYDYEYYYAKCYKQHPVLYKVPSKHNCQVITKPAVPNVPVSQLNIYIDFDFYIQDNGSVKVFSDVRMRIECRYSHGQLKGVPEAKFYLQSDPPFILIT
ncbi:hypothetical protein [Synechococcus sp. PCC 6312]|uniref:hypothetical protein n=1 Tax=Synechococcus sp. (strain ATCC 27167 / PCC 6312) TaxID=195253 RepID=UPI00029F1041|nr:hypothetical protein [Synechococcus sp. PCC 6312]AFY60296.1 hypothetical protein Syn6312_1106 [Synechococcus sp. PCC 6312]